MYSSSTDSRDVFVARLSIVDGAEEWGRQFGSSSSDLGRDVAVSADGGILLTGETGGDMYSSNAGSQDVFVTRLRGADGAEVWGRQFGSSSGDNGYGVAVSVDGGVHVTGQWGDDTEFLLSLRGNGTLCASPL